MMKAGLADKQKQQKSHEQHSVRMLAANLDLAARYAYILRCSLPGTCAPETVTTLWQPRLVYCCDK